MAKPSNSIEEYGFIKGKIDLNENPIECVKREVFEEVGILIDLKI